MSLLVQYSDSESEVESENEGKSPYKKLKLTDNSNNTEKADKTCSNRNPLPLPDSIIKLFDKEKDYKDDPSKHGGRVRTFAHEKGNWATLVYIPYEADIHFTDMITDLLLCLRPLDFKIMDDFHVSLSRTISIRHHWIQSFIESLKSKMSSLSSFPCEMTKLKVYTNDEHTRSFVAIEVISPSKTFEKYVKSVDQCFDEFKLQTYYKNPSFHISIAWCIGDMSLKITEEKMEELQNLWKTKCEEYPELKYFYAKKVECKTGNKLFHFNMTDT